MKFISFLSLFFTLGFANDTFNQPQYLWYLITIMGITITMICIAYIRKLQVLREKENLLLETLSTSQKIAKVGSFEDYFDHRGIIFSKENYAIWGFDPDGIVTVDKIMKRIHPDDMDYVNKMTKKVHEFYDDVEFKFRIIMDDGSIKYILANANVIFDAKNNFSKIIGTHQDITDKALLYNKLRELNDSLEDKVQEQTQTIKIREDRLNQFLLYSRTDTKGIITEASDVFCRLSEYTKAELIGQPHNIVRHPDMDPKLFEDMWDTIKSGKTWIGEIKNRAKSGHHYWVEARVTPEYDKDNKLIGYLSIRHDITARKDYEQQQMVILEQAKMAALGEMIGNIAHQWRQPLSVISLAATGSIYKKEIGFLEDEEFFANMNNINENAQYLSETINTFRDFVRRDRELHFANIYDELHSAVKIIEASLKSNFIKLIDQTNKDDSFEMRIYKNELAQVIINIINNATDIIKEREIHGGLITLDAKLKEKDNLFVVTIEDNGGGIPDDVLPHIFEPYFTTKHKSQGTGLGLHMSYRIITESFRGKIYATNSKNGAIFTIELPIL